MSLKTDLKQELAWRKLKFSDLNKKQNKQHKKEILDVLVRSGILDGKNKTQLAKELRSIRINNKPFRFNNEAFRDTYDAHSLTSKKIKPSKLPKGVKPNPRKIEQVIRETKKNRTGTYFYIFRQYLMPKSRQGYKHKIKTLPSKKSVIRTGAGNKYGQTVDIVVLSPELLTRKQAIAAYENFIYGEEDEELEGISFHGSDSVMQNFKEFVVTAYEYFDVLRDF